ncbi:hypothetical protein SAMD00019534_012760 [Acytostelium subglobosum LB1]|uniref:hypothetical protein n=1 Tax=Acytostelium subglobosum LB1 TaxID=1410327 RepID=UPI000644E106|nr:hypothetical protein SAMD00019534_012760 [Acytostelium subglobosum LB1]GAM18101.1 hypothetical protein SAMD00019534_012760 [Acytostelium subglobosum LB1]|eukprot:XP_012758697.1 hypothetical protein SAMD00019534_012760 [Acytostelium subglobosum LB1]
MATSYIKITDIIGKNVDTSSLTDVEKKVVAAIKADSFAFTRFNAFVQGDNHIKDPIGLIKPDTEVDKEDVINITLADLDCFPTFAPLFQGTLGMMWKKAVSSDNVGIDQLQSRVDQIAGNIGKIIQTNCVEDEEELLMHAPWSEVCAGAIQQLMEAVFDLKPDLSTLVTKLAGNQVLDDALLESCRTKFQKARKTSKLLMNFFANESLVQHTVKYLIEATFVNIVIIRTIDAFWYQLNFDENTISGMTANGVFPGGVRSYREMLDNSLSLVLSTIGEGARPENNDASNQYPSMNKAHMILKSNRLMYPVCCIMGKVDSRIGLLELLHVPLVKLPSTPSMYICRVDALQMKPELLPVVGAITTGLGSLLGVKPTPVPIEPLTGCAGSPFPIICHARLDQPRNVRLRFYGQYQADVDFIQFGRRTSIMMPTMIDLHAIDHEMGACKSHGDLKSFTSPPKGDNPDATLFDDVCYTAGYSEMTETFTNVKELTFHVKAEHGRLLFVEFIVSQ